MADCMGSVLENTLLILAAVSWNECECDNHIIHVFFSYSFNWKIQWHWKWNGPLLGTGWRMRSERKNLGIMGRTGPGGNSFWHLAWDLQN